MDDYALYKPVHGLKYKNGEIGAALCMVAEDSGATGMFRIAVTGNDTIHVHLKLGLLLGVDPLPNTKFELPVHPNDMDFKE